ncbi:hypothetical protein GIY56_02600 [Paracoccus sp. YIM 132242]|uniref:Uncharacterized protein n=1 Tax=Paracoccus lichenicola TaxID=2665644 RepID=A0A6L6HJ17_9RHOB|nr:hypothetical protein [Paracoccus lichenicola]MTD99173.1 hypothetical protein [Paracoccus lichenicola]
MIRVIAVLILAVLGMADPARACTTQASSTFCTDGWVAQPMGGGDRRSRAEEQAGAWPGDDSGTDPSFGADGVYVEGAVAVDGPIPDEGDQL